MNPDVHLFLADRYGRLADRALWNGAAKRARRLQARAEWHYERAGFDDFPSAAAMAMPAPRPKLFIDARARPLRRDEDDAA